MRLSVLLTSEQIGTWIELTDLLKSKLLVTVDLDICLQDWIYYPTRIDQLMSRIDA